MVGSIERAWVSGVCASALLIGCSSPSTKTKDAEQVASTSSALAWGSERKILPENPIPSSLGCSVSLLGTTALIGANGYAASNGAAYVFVQSGKDWSEQAMLSGAANANSDNFGLSVALLPDMALVGAPNRDQPVYNTG